MSCRTPRADMFAVTQKVKSCQWRPVTIVITAGSCEWAIRNPFVFQTEWHWAPVNCKATEMLKNCKSPSIQALLAQSLFEMITAVIYPVKTSDIYLAFVRNYYSCLCVNYWFELSHCILVKKVEDSESCLMLSLIFIVDVKFKFYQRTISTAIHLGSHGNMTMPGLWVEANEPSIECFHKQVFYDGMSVPITWKNLWKIILKNNDWNIVFYRELVSRNLCYQAYLFSIIAKVNFLWSFELQFRKINVCNNNMDDNLPYFMAGLQFKTGVIRSYQMLSWIHLMVNTLSMHSITYSKNNLHKLIGFWKSEEHLLNISNIRTTAEY